MLLLFFISNPRYIEVHPSADDVSVIEDSQQQSDHADASSSDSGSELEIEIDDIVMPDEEEE